MHALRLRFKNFANKNEKTEQYLIEEQVQDVYTQCYANKHMMAY